MIEPVAMETLTSPVSVAEATCPLCGEPATRILAPELRRGTGIVHYCSACDHGFLTARPNEDLKSYYASEYRQAYSHNAEVKATNARELYEVYRNFQADRLREIVPCLTRETRLLEVGASAGQFLSHVKEKVAAVNAVELDTACCDFLAATIGIDADSEYLENSRFAGRQYDVVCAFQVMEHVGDPVAFLRTLADATRPGGILFIEVPSLRDPLLSVWDVPVYRKFFYHSAHLHYFTEDSLRKVAAMAGFNPANAEISFTQDYNLLNHLHWIMNNGPQSDCLVGLSEVRLWGRDNEMSAWLTAEMKALNDRYMRRLVDRKCTSNMMLKLRREA